MDTAEKFSELDIRPIVVAPPPDLNYQEPIPARPITKTDLSPVNDILSDIFTFPERSTKKPEFRVEQKQYIYTSYEAHAQMRDAVIEGPTGLGKTRAIIASILPELINDPDARAIISTRTITQVNNILNELSQIFADEQSSYSMTACLFVGVVRLRNEYIQCYKGADALPASTENQDSSKSKPKIKSCKGCLRSPYHGGNKSRNETAFRHFPDKIITKDNLKKLFNEYECCPRHILTLSTQTSKIVVMPHDNLYDPIWMEDYFPKKEDVMLVLDEAHNFVSDASSNPYLTINFPFASESTEPEGDSETNEEQQPEADSKENERAFNLRSNIVNIHTLVDYFVESYWVSQSKDWKTLEIEGIPIHEPISCLIPLVTKLQSMFPCPELDDENIEHPLKIYEDASKFAEWMMLKGKINFSKLIPIFVKAQEEIRLERLHKSYLRQIRPPITMILQFVHSLTEIHENPFDFVVESRPESLTFRSLHPSMKSRKALQGFRSRILTSATISPPQDVSFLMNLRSPLNIQIPPIFPPENYLPFFVVGANSGFQEELKKEGKVFNSVETGVLKKILSTAIGSAKYRNIGIFCSSINAVSEVYNVLKEVQKYDNFLLYPFIQGKNPTQKEFKQKYLEDVRTSFVERGKVYDRPKLSDQLIISLFKEPTERTQVLLGVQGGTLSEGVDYKGQEMEMVIAIGLPYPASAAEIRVNSIRSDYFQMITENGNREYADDLTYKQDAFRKLAQSIGRANRSMKDRAVIICIDERLVAVKNVQSSGTNRYEFLSSHNANKNLKLLQKPFHSPKNVVMGLDDYKETKKLKKYIKNHLGVPESAFINVTTMGSRINSFYAKGRK